MIDGTKRTCLQLKDVRSFLDSILSEDTHAKRVDSLANAALEVMTGASLAVAMIGKSLAQARGLLTKHAVKQVDRLLSNPRIAAWDVFATWVPDMVGPRKDIVVAMDWTDFDADGQATLALKLVTRHGRATPLVWLSVLKDELKNARNDYEDACLRRLAEVLPDSVRVTLLADRGFADTKLFDFLADLGFDYVIRLKGNTTVRRGRRDDPSGGRVGRPRRSGAQAARCHGHRGAVPGRRRRVRAGQGHEGSLVSGGEQRRCILTADHRPLFKTLGRGAELPRYQGSALWHGLSSVRISDPQRRDRLLLLNAFAVVLLTLLGAAGESLGMDRHLKSNTVKTRTHSLFRQGCMLYDLIPNMPEHRLKPLIQRYAEILQQSRVVTETFAIV